VRDNLRLRRRSVPLTHPHTPTPANHPGSERGRPHLHPRPHQDLWQLQLGPLREELGRGEQQHAGKGGHQAQQRGAHKVAAGCVRRMGGVVQGGGGSAHAHAQRWRTQRNFCASKSRAVRRRYNPSTPLNDDSPRPDSSSDAMDGSLGGGLMAFCLITLPAMPMSMPARWLHCVWIACELGAWWMLQWMEARGWGPASWLQQQQQQQQQRSNWTDTTRSQLALTSDDL